MRGASAGRPRRSRQESDTTRVYRRPRTCCWYSERGLQRLYINRLQGRKAFWLSNVH